MKKESRIEREYRDMMTQAAPDLWERIESGLAEHPERIAAEVQGNAADAAESGGRILRMSDERKLEAAEKRETQTADERKHRTRVRRIYAAGTAAAAVLVLLVAAPQFLEMKWGGAISSVMQFTTAGGSGFAANMAGAGQNEAELDEASEMVQETMTAALTEGIPEDAAEAGGTAETAAEAGGTAETAAMAGAGAAPEEMDGGAPGSVAEGAPESVEKDASGSMTEGVSGDAAGSGSEDASKTLTEESVSAAELASQILEIPEDAVTEAADAEIFTEEVLKETQLLCLVTVREARLAAGADGQTDRIVYETEVEQIYYAGAEALDGAVDVQAGSEMTVESVIVCEADGNQALYQMLPGSEYLLPLARRDGAWEPVFQYAPQIRLTADGGYIFHDGYQSLADGAAAAEGRMETDGEYCGRMLERTDADFPMRLAEIIGRYAELGDGE